MVMEDSTQIYGAPPEKFTFIMAYRLCKNLDIDSALLRSSNFITQNEDGCSNVREQMTGREPVGSSVLSLDLSSNQRVISSLTGF